MKLGESLARSRGRRRSDDAGPGEAPPPRSGGRGSRIDVKQFLTGLAGLTVVGWLVGYLLATVVFFPAPPPPGDLFEVPDVRGLGLASASERLAGAGLELGSVDSLSHPSAPSGLVLGQSPLPGQVARPETPVGVTVSIGPEMRSVPDVRRLAEQEARVVLESSGFVVAVDTMVAEEQRGRVIDVIPRPDSVVALPASVRLIVSAGPPLVSMPMILGMEQLEAQILLDSLGLTVSEVEEVFRFGRDQGIVVEQEPPADTQLQRGSSVRLSVGRRGRDREQ